MVAAQPVVNVYAEASVEAEVTSQVLYGWSAAVLERSGDWGLVRTHDGYSGWLKMDGLVEDHGHAGDILLRVESSSANVYAEPDVKRRPAIHQLPWEARLRHIPGPVDEEGRWLRVRLTDGRQAFVQRGDIATDWPLLDVEAMLNTGRRFLGVTYTWGGVSSFGYDCSGFVQMMLRQRGITIPRDAQAQARWIGFLPIPVHETQAGDVLFFGVNEDEITHVGMGLGAGEFLHDTTEGRPGIQISHLQEMPWRERVCAARRLRP